MAVSRIDTIADITSHLWAFHTKLRREVNNSGSATSSVQGTNVFKCNGHGIEWPAIKTTIKQTASLYGFKYGTGEKERNATGTMGSILALFDLYSPKFNEVRMGTQKKRGRSGHDEYSEIRTQTGTLYTHDRMHI